MTTRNRGAIPASILWPGMVCSIIGLSLTISMSTLRFATGDPSVAAEESYYEKAMRWDEFAELRDRSAALGWSASVQIQKLSTSEPVRAGVETESSTAVLGDVKPIPQREIRITLVDAGGAPLHGATVKAFCFHHARRAETFTVELGESKPGVYTGGAAMPREGLYEVRIDATRGDDRFFTKLDVPTGGSL